MPRELTEDEILENDVDPIDGINAIRREQELGSKESEESESSEAEDDQELETDTNSERQVTESDDDDDDDDSESDEGEDEDEGEKLESKEPVKRTFKADGKEYSFTEAEMLEQFEGVFGKAINFTQKTQKLAPYRKMISALEEQNLSEQDFNLALDLLKGDKAAIKKLAQEKEIDLSDLAYEESDEEYKPNSYGKSEFEEKIQEIESSIGSDPEYKTTVDVIDRQWDDNSRNVIAENPDIILGLHSDIKTGVYAQVAPEAMKLQILDGNSKSSLEYYLLAGKKYTESQKAGNSRQKVDELNKGAQEAESKYGRESSEAEARKAATNTASRSGKKSVTDYLDDDNDEKFESWYKKLQESN